MACAANTSVTDNAESSAGPLVRRCERAAGGAATEVIVDVTALVEAGTSLALGGCGSSEAGVYVAVGAAAVEAAIVEAAVEGAIESAAAATGVADAGTNGRCETGSGLVWDAGFCFASRDMATPALRCAAAAPEGVERGALGTCDRC